MKLSGKGQHVTPKLPLVPGLAIFRLTHNGKDNFIAVLLDDTGERIEGLVNVIGPFNGSKAVQIDQEGKYLVNIDADGAWTLSVEQPVNPTGVPLPMTIKGNSQSVSPFFASSGGLATLQMSHQGRSNFAVWVIASDGERVDLATNVIGPFEGSKAVKLDPGTFFIQVEGEGSWAINIS